MELSRKEIRRWLRSAQAILKWTLLCTMSTKTPPIRVVGNVMLLSLFSKRFILYTVEAKSRTAHMLKAGSKRRRTKEQIEADKQKVMLEKQRVESMEE